MNGQRASKTRSHPGIALAVAVAALLAAADGAHAAARAVRTPVAAAPQAPRLNVTQPSRYSVHLPGALVYLEARVDLPGAPAAWEEATFFVDGQPIPAATHDTLMAATWDPESAPNPSQHSIYATARVRTAAGRVLSLDTRRRAARDAGGSLFAVANAYVRRVDFPHSHPVWHDNLGDVTTPTTGRGPDVRPNWELLDDSAAPYQRGPYNLCQTLGKSTPVTLETNVPATSRSRGSLRVRLRGALPAWKRGWHTVIPLSGTRGRATTPPLSEAVAEETMRLRLDTEFVFSDGRAANARSQVLHFTTWTDFGPREPDPVLHVEEAAPVPPVLRRFVLPPALLEAAVRQYGPFLTGRTPMPVWPPLSLGLKAEGTLEHSFVLFYPSAHGDVSYPLRVKVALGSDEYETSAILKYWRTEWRGIIPAWTPTTYSGEMLPADEMWHSPSRAAKGGYELFARRGSIVIGVDISDTHGKAVSPDVAALAERVAWYLLQQHPDAGGG